jgi:hypothetical protein
MTWRIYRRPKADAKRPTPFKVADVEANSKRNALLAFAGDTLAVTKSVTAYELVNVARGSKNLELEATIGKTPARFFAARVA